MKRWLRHHVPSWWANYVLPCYAENPHRPHLVVIGRGCWWVCLGVWVFNRAERAEWRRRMAGAR